MKADSKARSPRTWEITVESDWFTTLGAVALFVVCGLLLVREIDHFMWGRFSRPLLLHRTFWTIWDSVFETIAAIYCFMFAFKFPKKSTKIAFVLMGTDLAGFVLLRFFHTSSGVRQFAAMSGSVVRQVALAIFCVTLAQWLRSVVRWSRPSEPQGGES